MPWKYMKRNRIFWECQSSLFSGINDNKRGYWLNTAYTNNGKTTNADSRFYDKVLGAQRKII